VESLSRFAPGSKLVVRLTVINTGSEWPLERKFGVNISEAVKLLEKARALGLMPWGLSFHVGSQCTLPETWLDAMDKAQSVWNLAAKKDIHLKSLNLGGGFPVEYRKPVPEAGEYARVILNGLQEKIPGAVDILVEPGRAITGHAGTMVATVIAKAMRNRKRWLYLDVGLFNGLMESIGGIKYSIAVERQGEPVKWILAGSSCDGLDVIDKEVYIPDVEIGDRVLILSAGAYTTAYASTFGGAPIPPIYIL
jgi:ornithine decarboxylase